jgi:polysaccharide deacetylase family protein (PEP-CTERM system associated)
VRREPESTIANVLTVDVEEYYHGVEFAQALGADGLTRLPSRVVGETERLLDVLDAHDARGTFFTLGIVARRYPRLVRAIAERGHEIASHGWDHSAVDALGPERFRLDVRSAKRALEEASGGAVWGYRAPNYSIRRETPWAYTILYEEGYIYDSSIYPIAHDRYGFPSAPRFPHVVMTADGDLWEVPIGTARLAGTNLPIGGGFFRLVPEPLLREAIASVNRIDGQPVVLYIHPWEFDPDQPRPPMSWLHRFRHYVGVAGAERKLRALLRQFRFTSIESAFEQIRTFRSVTRLASDGRAPAPRRPAARTTTPDVQRAAS